MLENIKTLYSVTHIRDTNELEVKWFNVVSDAGSVISRQEEYRVFNVSQKADFIAALGVDSTAYITMAGW